MMCTRHGLQFWPVCMTWENQQTDFRIALMAVAPDTLLKPWLRLMQTVPCLMASVTQYALTFLINGVTTRRACCTPYFVIMANPLAKRALPLACQNSQRSGQPAIPTIL